MSVRLSERDLRVLAKCAVCRWLTTSQLQRLYFPHVTPDAVSKSLRRLHNAGYLVSHREHRTVHRVQPAVADPPADGIVR